MTDPKDELGARFDDRRADSGDNESDESGDDEAGDNMSHSDTTDNPNNTDTTDNSYNTGNTSSAGNASKPGPNPDPDSTRNRRQLAMYLPESKAEQLNNLYDRLDGQSKIAGEGGIEKHADFMEALVELAVDHEDELADRLGIEE
ncbi:hypothetical protein J2751_002454 [Halorubrum alkaliphilum]|uniref:DUF8160 domain-containing protein n=1 Tax=Halorubrum alkaliphilum TaxID=261290 RepID=A0A8T4GK29_9EURY|nr:hypothetical protein [Halorubrum alkaliphilum]MBP1923412.1 hypothetical protein [Halorubrum alkaliphilum]